MQLVAIILESAALLFSALFFIISFDPYKILVWLIVDV